MGVLEWAVRDEPFKILAENDALGGDGSSLSALNWKENKIQEFRSQQG